MTMKERDRTRANNWLKRNFGEHEMAPAASAIVVELEQYAFEGGKGGGAMRVGSWWQLRSQLARYVAEVHDQPEAEKVIRSAKYPIKVKSRPGRQARCRKVSQDDYWKLVEACVAKEDFELEAALYIASRVPIRPSELPLLEVTTLPADGSWVLIKTGTKKREDRGMDVVLQLPRGRDYSLEKSVARLKGKPMRPIQERLRRLSMKLFPRRKHPITFYSFRHQYSSDLKGSGVPREVIAGLMGHRSEKSQGVYGNPRSGRDCDPHDFMRVVGVHHIRPYENRPPSGRGGASTLSL